MLNHDELKSLLSAIQYLSESKNDKFKHAIEVLGKYTEDNYTFKVKIDKEGNTIKYK